MAFKRQATQLLSSWYSDKHRKPLILRGARQVGKSTAVHQLANQAPFYIELNLERHEDLMLIKSCNSANELMQRLGQQLGKVDFPDDTLIFVDEVQEHAEAVKWLRFFYEDHPKLAVIVAGSLFEIRLRENPQSIPVGRVEFMRLEPLSFIEFLVAIGDEMIAKDIECSYFEERVIDEGLHQLAMVRFRLFLLVGGLPEAVAIWCTTKNHTEVFRVHQNILQGYREDLLKYGKHRRIQELQHILTNAPTHYGGRYKTTTLAAGLKEKQVAEAIDLLEQAMVVYNVRPTANTQVPFTPRARAAKKLLPLDVGLALSQLNTTPEQLKNTKIESLLDGRIAEMFVGVQLLGRHTGQMRSLFFWTREGAAKSNAEIDYIISTKRGVVPVEVKAGATGTLKSLHAFMEKSKTNYCVRFSSARGGIQKLKGYTLHSLPLYMAELVARD